MHNIIGRVKEISRKIEDLRTKQTDECKTLFHQATKELFAQYPNLQSFGWIQYTPFFCDGDTCYFGVHCDEYGSSINGLNADEISEIEMVDAVPHLISYTERDYKKVLTPLSECESARGTYEITFGKEWWKWLDNARADISQLVDAFPNDILQALFGDHVAVTCNRDGTSSTSEYDHD